MPQRLALVTLALVILVGDASLDLQMVRPEPAWVVAACVRTVLLLLTLVALFKPGRKLVLLALVGVLMDLVRRGMYLFPLLQNLAQNDFLLQSLVTGLDLGFRMALLGWGLSWFRSQGKEA